MKTAEVNWLKANIKEEIMQVRDPVFNQMCDLRNEVRTLGFPMAYQYICQAIESYHRSGPRDAEGWLTQAIEFVKEGR